MFRKAAFLAAVHLTAANDNGLALLPPMGWRSWNLFGADVSQGLMERVMDAVASRKRSVDGKPTSLCDLGYCDVGLDDNWQVCSDPSAAMKSKAPKTYHDEDGNPIVNTERFPDMKGMVDYAHSLNLTAGWYANNCICQENDKLNRDRKFYEGDARALRKFGFDGIKLDGCGQQLDMQMWDDIFKSDGGPPVMVENCHWGVPWKQDYKPTRDYCPWNFYRTSVDVKADFHSIMGNLRSVSMYSKSNLSYPGCWAYPDMLEVGCDTDGPGLTWEETRSHFGAWVIVSSPLTLSLNVTDDAVMDKYWPIIANWEAIEVSQSYFGFSGGIYKSSGWQPNLHPVLPSDIQAGAFLVAKHQYLYKPLSRDGSRTAVLLLNSGSSDEALELKLADVPDVDGPCSVRDIWEHKDLGTVTDSMKFSVKSHDAAFLRLDCGAKMPRAVV